MLAVMPLRTPLLALCLCLAQALSPPAYADGQRPPGGKALEQAVAQYLAAPFQERVRMRAAWDRELAPLEASQVSGLRKAVLKAAARNGPELPKGATDDFLGPGRGKVLQQGKPGKVLWLGLHGGGLGSGDAESAAGAMGGGGWWWLFPEVLQKTEHGWTDAGTEEYVVELVRAAKRQGRVDPNRIYITGHSMGGYGTWTIGAHHADLFAGAAAYAGAPTCLRRSASDPTIIAVQPGILPSFYNLRLQVYQSGDDQNVPPESNDFAVARLQELRQRWPEGFDFAYERVEGRGHAGPAAGYLPTLKWVSEHARNPRPAHFLWQPVLTWKRQFYWLYWSRPELDALLEVRALPDNVIDITVHQGGEDLTGLSLLLAPELVDFEREVEVRVQGKPRLRARVQRTFSTLMMTLDEHDPDLLYDARIDL